MIENVPPFGNWSLPTHDTGGKLMETQKGTIIWCFRKAGFPGGKRFSSRWLLATGSGYDF